MSRHSSLKGGGHLSVVWDSTIVGDPVLDRLYREADEAGKHAAAKGKRVKAILKKLKTRGGGA